MKSQNITGILIAAVANTMSLACSDGNVDIGEDNPQAVKSGLAAYAGNWDGYVEAYVFESGTSDRVRLSLNELGQGHLRLGERALFAPPTEPSMPHYPPQTENSSGVGEPMPYEGFEYSLQGSIVESARIRSGASVYEVYRDYCAIQVAPYPYRDRSTNMSIDAPWEVGFSTTPVTFAGTSQIAGVCSLVIFESPPSTIEELTTTPTRSLPCADYRGGDPVQEFNLLHPDFPLMMPMPMEQKCSYCLKSPDATYHLDPALSQTLDIKLDGALENKGDTLVGSLTLPARSQQPGEVDVRTVRLTRQ